MQSSGGPARVREPPHPQVDSFSQILPLNGSAGEHNGNDNVQAM